MRLRTRKIVRQAGLALLALLLALPAAAATTGYTDEASFLAALPAASTTADFDALTPGSTIPSSGTAEGIVFTYSLDGATALVTDAHDAPSPANQLGLSGGDEAFLDGDALTLGFAAPVAAVALRIVTSDPADPSEILLDAAGGSVGNAATPERVLADGGRVHFLGIVSDTPFSSATLSFAADEGVHFVYNVDDVIVGEAVICGDGHVGKGPAPRKFLSGKPAFRTPVLMNTITFGPDHFPQLSRGNGILYIIYFLIKSPHMSNHYQSAMC